MPTTLPTKLVYLRTPNVSNKPPACQACQQRKRKCDRKRPKCSMCEKRNINCVFESRSQADLPKDLVDALHEKDERIALLERIIRERVPELAHIQSLSTSAIGAVLAAATEKNGSSPNFSALLRHTSTASAASGASAAASASGASTTAAPDALAQQALATSPVVNRSQLAAIDPGNYERLSPDLIAFVEGKLSEVELGHGAGVQSSVVSYITKQLGVNEPDADGDGVEMPAAAWPPYELAVQVVEVFVQNNSLWPVFRKTDLMHDLEEVYQHGTAGDPDQTATPLQTYRLFLIFSIACVWLAQRGNGGRINTVLLRNRALLCLPTVLRTQDRVTSTEALVLLCVSAIYDWGGADHLQLTPIVGHVAQAIGLHEDPPAHLPLEEKDRRRLLFWGIYCMERAVAGNLGRPAFFPEMHPQLPSRMDPVGGLGEGIDPHVYAQHMCEMWNVTLEVNLAVQRNPSAREVEDLHHRLDEWYGRTPRPRHPQASPSSPHTSVLSASSGSPAASGGRSSVCGELIFDEYYNLLLSILYRPRNLSRPPIEHIHILQESASEAFRITMAIQAQGALFDNYYQFNSIIGLGVTLLCSLLLFGGNEANAYDPTWCAAAVAEVGQMQAFIGSFCRGWPYARGMSRAFDSLAARTIARISAQPRTASSPVATAAAHGLPDMNTQFINAEVALAENGMTDLSLTTSAPMSALELPYHTDDAWEEWINECLVPADMQGVGMSANANLETLLASIGQSEDWFAAMVSGGPYHPRPA